MSLGTTKDLMLVAQKNHYAIGAFNAENMEMVQAIIAAATLSDRYISDRFLPDKAIDRIDEACSDVNLKNPDLIRTDEVEKEIGDYARERELLAPVRNRASAIIDTSNLSTGKLRGQLIDLVAGGMREHSMDVRVAAFGFKYGLPLEADLVFDVRFLPNPYYIPELKHQTGLDEPVRSFVFKYQQTLDFVTKTEDLLSFLLPNYLDEGKTDLVIAVGCTGGKHRSVCIAKELFEFVSKKGYAATLRHRDMGRRCLL